MTAFTSQSVNQKGNQKANRKGNQLFGKFATVVLCLGLIVVYLVTQLVGVYVFTPLVLKHNSLSISEIFLVGGSHGTVVAYSMLLTWGVMTTLIVGVVGLKIRLQSYQTQTTTQNPPASHSSNLTPSSSSSSKHSRHPNSTPVIPQSLTTNPRTSTQTTTQITISHYLALHRFSLRLVVGFVGLWLLFMVASEALTHLLDKNPTAFMDELYASAQPKWLLVAVVVLAVPIYEELMFRGVMWSALREQMTEQAGVWLATLVTSGLFAILHVQYEFYEMSIIFVLALLLSFARYKSGSLWLPILIHVLNNGVAMWLYIG